MSEIINLYNTDIKRGDITYRVTVHDETGTDKDRVVITAKKGNQTHTISLFASQLGKSDDTVFDANDRVAVTGIDDSSFELDKAVINSVLKHIANKNIETLNNQQNQDGGYKINPEKFFTAEGTFDLMGNGRQPATLDELSGLTFSKPDPVDMNNPAYYSTPAFGAPPGKVVGPAGTFTTPSSETTVTKELTDEQKKRKSEYETKLSELTGKRSKAERELQRLSAHLPQVEADVEKWNHESPCLAPWREGYVSAGNGTPIDMYNKFMAKIKKAESDLEVFDKELEKLNTDYKDIVELIKTETKTIPGTTISDTGANAPTPTVTPAPTGGDADKKPKTVDEAKTQTTAALEAAKKVANQDAITAVKDAKTSTEDGKNMGVDKSADETKKICDTYLDDLDKDEPTVKKKPADSTESDELFTEKATKLIPVWKEIKAAQKEVAEAIAEMDAADGKIADAEKDVNAATTIDDYMKAKEKADEIRRKAEAATKKAKDAQKKAQDALGKAKKIAESTITQAQKKQEEQDEIDNAE